MTLAGAVITSALVSGSAQMVVDRSALAATPPPPPARPPAAGAPGDSHGGADLFLEFGGDLLGVCVLQITHLGVAAAFERRVEMGDQRLDAQPRRLVAADEHAVGAIVGDDAGGRAAAAFRRSLLGEERIDHPDHFAGRGMLQVDDVDLVVALLVDAIDDAHHAADVAGAIRNDEDVAGRIGRQVRGLRHQRAQHRHQLRRIHVFDGDDLGDELFRTGITRSGQIPVGHLAGVGIRHDLDDAAGFHGDELVDLQQRQEGLVEASGVIGVCDSMVTCARTRPSGMMVLPVTCATASMTWPISTSLKLGVMRWPLLWALTRPAVVKAMTSTSSPSAYHGSRHCVLYPGARRALTVLLFICLFFLFVPGTGSGSGGA